MKIIDILYLITIPWVAITIFLLWKNPTSLWCGAFFLMDLALFYLCLFFQQDLIQNQIFAFFIVSLAIIMFFTMLFFTYIIVFFTLINTIQVFRHEKISLSTSLTLILAIGNIILILLGILDNIYNFPLIVKYLLLDALLIEGYFILWFLAMLVTMELYHLHRISKKAKYIIVLGAGLTNGNECSPLLKGRIEKGVERYYKQRKRGNPTFLVMSGGQGEDELISEASAMKSYAFSIGVDEHQILCEEKSKNTLENMKFSRELIDQMEAGVKESEICFITSDYHVLRAARDLRRIGYRSNGEGSRTARYFMPNALIREYIARLKEAPKFHIFIVIVLLLIPIFVYLATNFISLFY